MTKFVDCHYTKTGKGPGLFLIHGIGAAKDAWRLLVTQLSKHFTVITYDLRGHGKSPVTNLDFTLNDLIADLERLREKTKIEKAHFIGHSLGGMIAPAYAKKFPDNTLSVGLLSTVAGRSTEDRDKVLKIIKSMELEGITKILPTLKTRWFTDHFIKNNPSIVEKRIKQDFESFEKFREEFINAGVTQFGSGWCWLSLKEDKLVVTKSPNAENPIIHNMKPILGCDVWEHSYYLDYKNKRPAYLENFFDKLINWEFVESNL